MVWPTIGLRTAKEQNKAYACLSPKWYLNRLSHFAGLTVNSNAGYKQQERPEYM